MRVNPYLFLLLKRMIEFDVKQTLRKVSNRERVYEYVLSSGKIFTSGPDAVTAGTFAQYLRRYIWSKDDFDFPISALDKMCQTPFRLKSFTSWDQFSSTYANAPDTHFADQYTSRAFGRLPHDIQQEIAASVEMRLGKMYERYKASIKREKERAPLDLDEEDTRKIKLARLNDIMLIAELARRVYPCPINDFEKKRVWFEKNQNIFIVCIDEYGELLANMNLLPLSTDFYRKLKSGAVYEDEITAADIFEVAKKNEVECVYIEGYASISTDVQRQFRRRFAKMLSGIADDKNEDLTICSFGGSPKWDQLMKKYKFEQTGWAVDRKTGVKYPFFEIRWGSLKGVIERLIEASESIHR